MSTEENQIKSIPVIGVPVVSNPYWITRLLMSIDYPVDNFVVINNNGRGQIDEELDNLKNITHKFVKNIKVCHLPANIGCGGAWNLIVKCYMMAPYWIIVNDDVAFGPGFLKEMTTTAESDPNIGMIHGHSGDYGVGSWDLFLIRDHIVKQFGLFDENLYPAYCEDADYLMRFYHRPIRKVMSLDATYYHGHGDKSQYYKEGSQTQKTEPELEAKLDYANEMNIEYLTEKWGQGWRVCNPQDLPFKDKEQPVSATTYDLEFVRKNIWGSDMDFLIVNPDYKKHKRIFIVDNFYKDPDSVRKFALQQEFFDDPGYIGRRTRQQFFLPGTKEAFEDIMGEKITAWEEYGMNGRFQHNWSGENLVYHCDVQKWAAMVYLSPDAPSECGTTMWRHRKTKVHHNEQIDWSTGQGYEVFPGRTFLDRTPYEPVDVCGNIYNRLVIFDGGCIHSASEYFGDSLENCRLWHMFFFDAE